MKKNESKIDRIVRLVAGLVFAAIALFAATGVLQIVLYVLAVIMLVTSATGFCALYKLFGIDTDKKI